MCWLHSVWSIKIVFLSYFEGSDWETDEDASEESEEEAYEEGVAVAVDVDEESDGESEKCPVCLDRLEEQNIGTPESCDHNFCLECILQWSNVIPY